MRTPVVLATLMLAAGLVTPGPVTAQDTGTFTLTQGDNQIATETFTRSGDALETELTMTGQGIIATEAALGSDGTVTRIDLRILPPGNPDADPLQSVAAEFTGDSVHVEQPIGTASASGPAPAGTVPYVNPSPSYIEQILRRARALEGPEPIVRIWAPGQGPGQLGSAQVAFGEDDTATVTIGNAVVEVRTDEEGRLLHADVPAQGLTIERQ